MYVVVYVCVSVSYCLYARERISHCCWVIGVTDPRTFKIECAHSSHCSVASPLRLERHQCSVASITHKRVQRDLNRGNSNPESL